MPFASTARRELYERLNDAIVDEASSHFTDFIGHEIRSVDHKKWKLIKSREQVAVYRATRHPHRSVLPTDFDHAHELEDWIPSTRLLCVGKLRGSIEEAMYGCLTPTHTSMVARSVYVKDQLMSHRILDHVCKPSEDDPFRYLGVRRAVRASQMRGMLRAREITFVEATGMREVCVDGRVERRGYMVWHSIDAQDYPPEHDCSEIRARISLCVLFRELSADVVELYGTLASDPGGKVSEKLAATSIASVLIAVSRVMECAFSKKLFWLLQTGAIDEAPPSLVSVSAPKICGCCVHKASTFSTLTACELCHESVCWKCIIQRKLVFSQSKNKVFRRLVNVCKRCITSARCLQHTAMVGPHRLEQCGQMPVSAAREDRFVGDDEELDVFEAISPHTRPQPKGGKVRRNDDAFDGCIYSGRLRKGSDLQRDALAKKINDLVRAAEETHQLAWRLSEACTKSTSHFGES